LKSNTIVLLSSNDIGERRRGWKGKRKGGKLGW
jgi:hypothetical protein